MLMPPNPLKLTSLSNSRSPQEIGCEVVHVVGIVDRLQGGAAAFQARGLNFSALLTIRDFGIEPPPES